MGRFCTRSTFVAILIYSSFFKVSSFGQAQTRATAEEDEIRRFLVEQFQEPGFSNDKTTKYSYAEVDLNGDGVKEVVVYLTGRDWCGTGGCNTFILARAGSSYKIVTEMTITRPPIRVLANSTHGWHNIGVWVVGGGIQPGYEAELPFDGKTYPTNPSVPPARRAGTKAKGKVVIASSAEGKLLYP